MFADAYLEKHTQRRQYNCTYNLNKFRKLLPSFFVFSVEPALREYDFYAIHQCVNSTFFISTLEIVFVFFKKEFREGTYAGLSFITGVSTLHVNMIHPKSRFP
jgi:hypothetical protein